MDIIDLAEYNVLKLNKNSWDILKGEKNLSGTLIEGKSTYVVNEPINYDTELFEMLRLARKSISVDKHIPPYAVFSDKTLIDISTYYPQSKESLLKMHGLGEQKTRKYGSILLEIIIGYCADKEISDLSHKIIRITKIPKSTSRRYHEVGKMFNSGLSLDEITEQLSVKTDTVIKHLFKFKREGNALMHKIEINLPEQEIISIEDAFSELGTDLLKPIYQRFEEKYSYEILRKILLNYL